jgi:hypothetical protein
MRIWGTADSPVRSNRGSVDAFWITNARGAVVVRKAQSVEPRATRGLHYCSWTVTNAREWFDSKNPNVRFQFTDGKLVQVLARGCDGADVRLLK